MSDSVEEGNRRLPRLVQVGWLLDIQSAAFVWEAPRRVTRGRGGPRHAKSLTQCPAVLDMDARLFEVVCPIDAAIGIRQEPGQAPVLVNLAGDQSGIRSSYLNRLVSLVGPREWADPKRPIIQFVTPYVFVADEPVFLNQLPPFNAYRAEPWPGLVIGGRFPIDLWPRTLMWGFEWHDTTKPLILRRGEPWFYVWFDHFDPSRAVRLVEAELTEELRQFRQGLSGVTNYVNQTSRLLETARERRPERLLTAKEGRPAIELEPAQQRTVAAEQALVHGPSGEPEPLAAAVAGQGPHAG